jgi:hypothetical protein
MNCRLPPGQLSHYSLISGFLQCIHNNFQDIRIKKHPSSYATAAFAVVA